VPNADFIARDREGIVICDATSAAFAMAIDYERVDVVTFSFPKALGGEAGIGVAALGPRAVARLDDYAPPRAIPKVLRLRNDTGFDRALATGSMINTYSLWTLEDWIDALEWAQGIGGLKELIRRTDANAAALFDWVARTDWVAPLAVDPATRSTTSVCLKIVDPRVTALDEAGRQAFVKRMKGLLEAEGAAFDVESHRNAPAGLRLWCGCTVETEDVVAATPWLDWAFGVAISAVD
jgi:phosphoserine aminotransferase